jgi:cation diffusion facilitator CzcD-associated flavoprotein CzcO
MIETKNLIIGAGPAGLAMAGRLRKLRQSFEVIERSNRIAEAWHRHYDRLHLHTTKTTSALPHLPFPKSYPRYVSKNQLIEYYNKYAEQFEIQPHLGQQAVQVSRIGHKWHTRTQKGDLFISDQVIVCTGFNNVINDPEFEGKASFQGTIVHSRQYKNPEPYLGKKVLVVGMGNTGAEIALDLAEHSVETYLSVRGPVNIVPRDLNGRPTQDTAKILGKLPFKLGDRIGRLVQQLTIGDLAEYGIERPQIAPAAQLRLYAKTPVLDIGTVAAIKEEKIKVKPGIRKILLKGVLFKDESQLELDAIILATGYKAALSSFIPDIEPLLNHHQHPKEVHGAPTHDGLFFVGFDGYSSGILESIHRDSETVAGMILKR